MPSSGSSSPPLKPEILDDEWAEGDFMLVSSDQVGFRVQSYHVLSASSALREQHKIAAERGIKRIHFSDPEMETASVIRQFLSLATTGAMSRMEKQPRAEPRAPEATGSEAKKKKKTAPTTSNVNRETIRVINILRFLHKWECTTAAVLAINAIKLWLVDDDDPFCSVACFAVGATTQNNDLCKFALERPLQLSTQGWTEVDGAECRPTLDPRTLPWDIYSLIPRDYLWALGRTSTARNNPSRADEFMANLKEVQNFQKDNPPRT